jgi:caa(3)-type oxidase subunit IV
MGTTSSKVILGVWVFLIAATVVSVALGANEWSTAGAVAILSIAFAKVYLVGLYFMEIRGAPRLLRYTFACWCIAAWMVLIGLYVGVG